MPEKFLFVSHVSEDRAAAREIVDELERRGVRCWIAPRDVRAGRPFDDEIADAIDASLAMLLIFSERCNGSEYIRREVTFAGESRKVVIPFRIENAEPKHGLRVRLADLHWLDGFASREQAIDELIRTFPEAKQERSPEAVAEQAFHLPVPPVIARSGGGEAELERRTEEKRPSGAEPRPAWLTLRSAMAVGALVGAAVLGALGFWIIASRPTAVPVAQRAAPATSAPAAVGSPAITASACKAETAGFYDDFHKPDPGWNLSSNESYVAGQLVMTPAPDEGLSPKYQSLLFENATICAHIKSPPQMKVPEGMAGVIFWAVNNENYYVVQFTPGGSYSIYRKQAGTWINLVPATKNDQIKTGANAVNEVSVVLVDNFGALFINNVKVQEFRGQPPKGGGAVGLHAESEPAVSDEWRFLDITVMDDGKSAAVVLPAAPSGPTIAGCRPVNSTDFQDTFAKPDPAWGPHNFDGQLLLKPEKNSGYTQLYSPLVFKNATVCGTVKFPLGITDLQENSPGGGLAFWAGDYQNLYTATIFPNGTFSVFRRVNNDWITVVGRTPSDAIKKGAGAVNELQVVLKNSTCSLYINGVQVREFRGQPPKERSAIGFYAQSEDLQQNEWRFLNVTVVENQ